MANRGNFLKKNYCHDFATNLWAFLVFFVHLTEKIKPVIY